MSTLLSRRGCLTRRSARAAARRICRGTHWVLRGRHFTDWVRRICRAPADDGRHAVAGLLALRKVGPDLAQHGPWPVLVQVEHLPHTRAAPGLRLARTPAGLC